MIGAAILRVASRAWQERGDGFVDSVIAGTLLAAADDLAACGDQLIRQDSDAGRAVRAALAFAAENPAPAVTP